MTVLCILLLSATLTMSSFSFGQSVTVTANVEVTGNPSSHSADPFEAVVWLTPLEETTDTQTPRRQHRVELVQKKKSFSPHVTVVQVGESIEFPNRDPFFHNVFSLFEGKRFDLGLYEAGSSRTVVFDRAGISYIFCNIHAEMSAVVVVLRTPYYGISDRKGIVTIPNVPPGRYEMQAWSERALPEDLAALKHALAISESTHSLGVVHISEQRSVLLIHKNKYGQDYENPTPNLPAYVQP